MTLMTVLYGLILDSGCISTSGPLPLQLNPTNPTPRARSPLPMRSLRPLAASGLSNLPDNLTPPPDERDGPSSGYREHRRVPDTEPDDNKNLTHAGYSGYRRVRRVI